MVKFLHAVRPPLPDVRRTRRTVAALAALVLAALLGALAAPAPAAAAPVRADSKARPIYFVHGYAGSGGHDCATYWAKAGARLRQQGFTGTFTTWGYYSEDSGCSVEYGGNRDTSLNTLARELAWSIYNTHSRYGRSIDVVAHSMGGLIVRRAIAGIDRNESGYPGYLYVEDVATLGTPHDGTNWARGCAARDYQCEQMITGSAFLTWLNAYAGNPQSDTGTDWSVIGSHADNVVAGSKAIDMAAGHKYVYRSHEEIEHGDLPNHDSLARTFDIDWWHWNGPRSGFNPNGESVLVVTANALYRWSTW